MSEIIKKGDIVARKSYGKDIIFNVEKIIESNNNKIAILKGITLRIVADSPIEDLEIIEKHKLEKDIKVNENKIIEIINLYKKNILRQPKEDMCTGTILHLDGDKKYSEKSIRYYKKLGLNAIVKNIAENKQPIYIPKLLQKHIPDILVITGHDGMIKNGTGYNDIYNYRNSRHFINAVRVARQTKIRKEIAIFAGACQSYFEEIILAGANFASSPGRILIDFIDPLIVATKIATTQNTKYLTIKDIENDLRAGIKGIGGMGCKGKKRTL